MSFSSLETPSYLSFRCHSCQQRSSNTACRWWLSWPNVREPVTFRSQECVKGSVFKLALIPPAKVSHWTSGRGGCSKGGFGFGTLLNPRLPVSSFVATKNPPLMLVSKETGDQKVLLA